MKKEMRSERIAHKDLFGHETKRKVLFKFLLIVLVFFIYLFFVSERYGIENGLFITLLTWSFFVLCTPIADAGFLVDFPLRMITRIRMSFSEIFVYSAAILLNLYTFFLHPEMYSKTKILSIFKHILETPFPFWGIIVISAIGTFVSVEFGDELLDKVRHSERKIYHKHKHRHRLIILAFIFVLAFILYDFLLKGLGVDLPL